MITALHRLGQALAVVPGSLATFWPGLPLHLRWLALSLCALAALIALVAERRRRPLALLLGLALLLTALGAALDLTASGGGAVALGFALLFQFAGHSAALQMARARGTVPLYVLTGFLGSGKTTLLNALLARPELGDTAVIVNEFGEISIDHLLLTAADERMMTLSSGCVCCTVRGDLVQTVTALFERVAASEIPPFRRVVLETTGLADPGPILQTLMASRAIASRCHLGGVISVVDALRPELLASEPVARHQVQFADKVVLSKVDLLPPEGPTVKDWRHRLATLGPQATILPGASGDVDPDALLAPIAHAQPRPEVPTDHAHHEARTLTVVWDTPMTAPRLTSWLSTLVQLYGPDLFRIKGLVALTDAPDRPAVIHGVQTMVAPIERLPRWPDADERSRVVLIGRGLDRQTIEGLLHGRAV